MVVLEKCGVSCLKKECDFREDIEETLYYVQKMVPIRDMRWIWGWLNELIKIKFTFFILL